MVLVADAGPGGPVKIVKEFRQGLFELDKTMPARPTRGVQLNVTEELRPFLPKCETVQNAIDMFAALGLSAHRDKNADRRYFTYAYVEFDLLSTQGGTHFQPGDRLVINYSSESPAGDAKIVSFKASLLNDSSL